MTTPEEDTTKISKYVTAIEDTRSVSELVIDTTDAIGLYNRTFFMMTTMEEITSNKTERVTEKELSVISHRTKSKIQQKIS